MIPTGFSENSEIMKVDFQQLAGKRVCVALSGGRDSVCLLHALLSHAAEQEMTVSALTCEHGIRGAASLADLAFVGKLCDDWGVPLRVFRADVPALARENGTGLEETGREFRYACFQRVLDEGAADAVATAHHMDDAAETVLFRLARGTSSAGLNVFPARKGIVRPLLHATRAEIDAYAAEHALAFAEDETNADERFARNRLRRTVLPALEEIAPRASQHLVEYAARAAEDDAFLTALARASVETEGGATLVPVNLPAPVFSRACLEALVRCGVSRDYTGANLAEIARLKTLQSGRRVTLPKSVEAVREGEKIAFLCPSERETAGAIPFGYGVFQTGEYAGMVWGEPVEGALIADMDAFPADCVVRTRREGDMFTPCGGGRKTLKKFLTDRKIPARIGHALPLVASGSEVLAVFSVEISDRVKVTEETKRRAYLTLGANTKEQNSDA